jgi:hypothetical protein
MSELTTDTTKLLDEAQAILSNTINRASQSDIGGSIKNGLINSADNIQSILNDIFKNNGLITNEQVNQLDEQIKLAKLKLLESKSKSTITNLGMYVGIGVVVLGVLWFFTSKEN